MEERSFFGNISVVVTSESGSFTQKSLLSCISRKHTPHAKLSQINSFVYILMLESFINLRKRNVLSNILLSEKIQGIEVLRKIVSLFGGDSYA